MLLTAVALYHDGLQPCLLQALLQQRQQLQLQIRLVEHRQLMLVHLNGFTVHHTARGRYRENAFDEGATWHRAADRQS